MRVLKIAAVAAALAVVLSGCIPALVAGGIGAASLIARDVYCAGSSETGKQVVRNAMTHGQQVIACPEYVPAAVVQTNGGQK